MEVTVLTGRVEVIVVNLYPRGQVVHGTTVVIVVITGEARVVVVPFGQTAQGAEHPRTHVAD